MKRKVVVIALALSGIIIVGYLISCGGGGGGGGGSSLPPPVTEIFVVSSSTLYSSEIATSGADTAIGQIRLANGTPVNVTDVAVTPDGKLYAVSFNQLYLINASTAIATPVGTATLQGAINALGSDSDGNLYCASSLNGSLYTVDKNTGVASYIGMYGSNWFSTGDLAFDSAGVMWASVRTGTDTTDNLVTVNKTTGVATLKFSNLPLNLWGLSFANGTLHVISASNNSMYTIDTVTGHLTFIRNLSFMPYGAKPIY